MPEFARKHQTKAELALEMVRQARREGLSYRWVGGDEVYGNNRKLTDALDDDGEVFLMDITSTHQLRGRDPSGPAPAGNGLGRPRTRGVVADPKAAKKSSAQWAQSHFAAESREITLRESTRGALRAKIWVKEVWQWEPSDARARRRLLVVRQEQDGTFTNTA